MLLDNYTMGLKLMQAIAVHFILKRLRSAISARKLEVLFTRLLIKMLYLSIGVFFRSPGCVYAMLMVCNCMCAYIPRLASGYSLSRVNLEH